MKRVFLLIIAFLVCSSLFAQAVSLEQAVHNSAQTISAGLPQGTKVAILSFSSPFQNFTDYILDEIAISISNSRRLQVIERQYIDVVRRELNIQMSGEVSDAEVRRVGQQLGAQFVITGSLVDVGNAYRFRAVAINVETAVREASTSLNININDPQAMFLLTGQRAATTPAASSQKSSAPPAVVQISIPSIVISSQAGWNAFNSPSSGTSFTITNEQIDGQFRDVLTIQTRLGSDEKIAGIQTFNEEILNLHKNANGVRFKVLGDGKTWHMQVLTEQASADHCYYHSVISTRNNRVVNVDIPFSRLRQFDWGKKVSFIKSNITGLQFDRNGGLPNNSGTGASTIKIFDFEVY